MRTSLLTAVRRLTALFVLAFGLFSGLPPAVSDPTLKLPPGMTQAQLYKKLERASYKFLSCLLSDHAGNRETAEDIAADTVRYALEHPEKLRDPDKTVAYLRACVVNRTLQFCFRCRPHLSLEQIQEAGKEIGAEGHEPVGHPAHTLDPEKRVELLDECERGLELAKRAFMELRQLPPKLAQAWHAVVQFVVDGEEGGKTELRHYVADKCQVTVNNAGNYVRRLGAELEDRGAGAIMCGLYDPEVREQMWTVFRTEIAPKVHIPPSVLPRHIP